MSCQSDKIVFTHLYRAYEEEGTDTKRDDTGLREREHMRMKGHKSKSRGEKRGERRAEGGCRRKKRREGGCRSEKRGCRSKKRD